MRGSLFLLWSYGGRKSLKVWEIDKGMERIQAEKGPIDPEDEQFDEG